VKSLGLLFSIILVESALERIDFIANRRVLRKIHPDRSKALEKTILDVSIHNHLMQKLSEKNKRGRPDIIQTALLLTLGSRLNKEGHLRMYVHTRNNEIISLDPQVRIPRNYNRFIGLMEQLFEIKTITSESQQILLSIKSQTLKEFIQSIAPTLTILFSESGSLWKRAELQQTFSDQSHIAILVGGFPHGDFSPETLALADKKISIYPQVLDTLVVLSYVVSTAEQSLGMNE
jgi:rRNA small subunit pseudouridine methyltransferase Nep1